MVDARIEEAVNAKMVLAKWSFSHRAYVVKHEFIAVSEVAFRRLPYVFTMLIS